MRPELLDGLAHGRGVDDLAVAYGTFRERDLAELLEGDLRLAERELGRAHPRRPDVETDGGSSCHDANLYEGGMGPRGEPRRADSDCRPRGAARVLSHRPCRLSFQVATTRRRCRAGQDSAMHSPRGTPDQRPEQHPRPERIFVLRPALRNIISNSASQPAQQEAGEPTHEQRTPASQARYTPTTPASLTSPKPIPRGR